MPRIRPLWCLWILALGLGATQSTSAEPSMAHVRFILTGLTIPGATQVAPDRMAAKVQRTQWLVFNLAGGQAPWTVTPSNGVVRVEKVTDSQFKIVPQSEGTSSLDVVDSRGGGKHVDITVIPDRYGTETVVLNNNNTAAVRNGPTAPAQFSVNVGYKITEITTYHYNSGRGQAPGTITLKSADGRTYGPWQATRSGPFWVVRPNAGISSGSYTVVDSDPATWSWNTNSGGGFVIVKGAPRLPNP
jgi:hypothetical protein